MAIVCPGCGREYDAALFQLGRTIHCACGARVGLEQRIGPPLDAEHPRFFADAMLGRLARWLRTLGYDTAYDDSISDEMLVRRALQEGRHILTRDRKIPEEWRVEVVLIHSDKPLDQLRQVVSVLRLARPARLFSRCRVCNGTLEPATVADVGSSVPPRVLERTHAFARCRDCGRVYWEGSHTRRMRSVVDQVFSKGDSSGDER